MALDKKIQRDVLIVDDDVNICEILKEYCLDMGCFKNIIVAHDGVMASAKLRNQKFAVILLDVNMPKKSGLHLLEEFTDSAINSVSNVIIVSGTLEKETIGSILAKGIKLFLVKPFDEPTFQARVLKLLVT